MKLYNYIIKWLLDSDIVSEENKKFYQITQGAYLFGLMGHISAIFMFNNLGVNEMVVFNVFLSVPAFLLALIFNNREWHNLAFLFAFIELLLHQILTTYFVGWGFGSHFWLIYLAGLSFFNSQWHLKIHLFLLFIVIVTYIGLFDYCQLGIYDFPIYVQRQNALGNSITVLIALSLLIYYYTNSAYKAEQNLKAEQVITASMLSKIQWLFGQQVSKEVATQMMESESEIESKTYNATVMFLDIRDFTVFADSRAPSEVAKFQNIVFGALIDIVRQHRGVVLQLLGDGLMAVFGAPVISAEHAQNAVDASYVMLKKINELSDQGKIPKIRVGIGLNTGNIMASNLGNADRKFYSLTGKNVIIAARIEPLNKQFGSQLLISKSVFESVRKENLKKENLGNISLKGIENPVTVYRLV